MSDTQIPVPINKHGNRYMAQLVIPRSAIVSNFFPAWFIGDTIGRQLIAIDHQARDNGDTLDWSTFIASARHDGLLNAVLLGVRINAA